MKYRCKAIVRCRVDSAQRKPLAIGQVEQLVPDPGIIDGHIPREWAGFPRSSSFDGDCSLRIQAVKKLISVIRCFQRLVKRRRLKTPADI